MMDNIPNLRLEVLIDYVLTKRNVCNGETATEDGIDDIEENVATNSADKINIAQPEELMRNIFMLTKDQMLEAHLDQEKFMVIGF